MSWLHEHGVANGYQEYRRLPLGVLEDSRQWMAADLAHKKSQSNKAQAAAQRGRRAGR